METPTFISVLVRSNDALGQFECVRYERVSRTVDGRISSAKLVCHSEERGVSSIGELGLSSDGFFVRFLMLRNDKMREWWGDEV